MHIHQHAIAFIAAHRRSNDDQRVAVDEVADAAFVLTRVARVRL